MTTATRPTVQIERLLPSAPPLPDQPIRGGQLPEVLRQAYGGDLWIPLRADRPTLIANFVSTIDGVVSYSIPGQAGGGEISGFFEPDRFIMGLLRSLSDAVLIGAGTLRDTRKHVWSAEHTHPQSAAAFAELRGQLGLAPQPITFVVSASGNVDLSQRGLATPDVPVTIVTTDHGRGVLRRQAPFAPRVEVVATGKDRVGANQIVEILRDRGLRLVLTEGGPHLFGQLVTAGVVDELFITLAPQIAGRSTETPRLALVEGTAFTVAEAPWSQLVDLRKSGNHLFARYRLQEASK